MFLHFDIFFKKNYITIFRGILNNQSGLGHGLLLPFFVFQFLAILT